MNVNSTSSGGSTNTTRTGSSVLAPSKFSSNFLSGSSTLNSGSSQPKVPEPAKTSFQGLKASKLAVVAQALVKSPEPVKDDPSAISWMSKVVKEDPLPSTDAASTVTPLFIPMEKQTTSDQSVDSSNQENGDAKASIASPPKRNAVEKVEEASTSPKRIRLETAPPKEITPEVSKIEQVEPPKRVISPPLTSNPKPEVLSSFVFGENLTERADNFKSSTSQGFVFGQNLTERAENFSPEPREEKTEEPVTTAFVARPSASVQSSSSSSSDPKSPPKSLTESAAAYFESHATPKRKYEEVVVVTGEEGEVNVVQMSAKLYWFDKAVGNYIERGRGILRLNDIAELNAKHSAPPSSSRLVMRTGGSLRVILNTKLYRGMPVECPSEKTLRLTGMDDSGILRVFLVTGSSKDIANMHAALQFRLAAIEKASRNEGGKVTDSDSEDDEEKCGKIKAPRLV